MCTEVVVFGEHCTNQGGLALALGVEVADLPGYADLIEYEPSAHSPEICLCPISVLAALSMRGLLADTTSDPFAVIAFVPGHGDPAE